MIFISIFNNSKGVKFKESNFTNSIRKKFWKFILQTPLWEKFKLHLFNTQFLFHFFSIVSLLISPVAGAFWTKPTRMPSLPDSCSWPSSDENWLSIAYQMYDPVNDNWDIYTTSLSGDSSLRFDCSP